ncbi:MAG: hypothetical protein ACI841_004075 [Planctomycetota bacterium]|jgi:hypothetical protein
MSDMKHLIYMSAIRYVYFGLLIGFANVGIHYVAFGTPQSNRQQVVSIVVGLLMAQLIRWYRNKFAASQ